LMQGVLGHLEKWKRGNPETDSDAGSGRDVWVLSEEGAQREWRSINVDYEFVLLSVHVMKPSDLNCQMT
jgi:hypothetical protein